MKKLLFLTVILTAVISFKMYASITPTQPSEESVEPSEPYMCMWSADDNDCVKGSV